MKKSVAVLMPLIASLILTLAACGSSTASLDGTKWTGNIALTTVTVNFKDGGNYTSSHLGKGTYSVDGNQVSLTGPDRTIVFVHEGSIMQGSVDGWTVQLTKQ